ncbi:carboxylesterase [Sutterella sp.]|uniref:alpha/beta hydrolase n=1 Tax=Sutterella sp. TaxID=1981025 RepID=UPI0026E0FC2C|nr:alpha/beta fold hydrolase [Sutterella sp.]MDO5530852.1 alpha/beta fold hydrolase [Sutterella sp.]
MKKTPHTISRRRLLGSAAILALPGSAGLVACASTSETPPPVQPLGQTTFAQYAADTRAWVAARRKFVSASAEGREAELAWNTPSETPPAGDAPPKGGILLIHGLGDSPWSFIDQARSYAEAGWLVRTVLLPGCGTRPEDMLTPTADDWRQVVAEQAEILRRDIAAARPGETPQIWLAGFSTGCNLAIEFASEHEWVSGLVLFSPAVAVRTKLAFLAPVISPFVDWLREPEESMMGGQSPYRYTIVPVPALAAFVSTMRGAERALEKKAFDRPAVLMMSERDSVVDTQSLIGFFAKRFTNPATRFLWYGSSAEAKELSGNDPRVIVRRANIPEARISSFSHMGLLYRPDNPHYGRGGDSLICSRGEERPTADACAGVPETEIHYGAWGDKLRTGVRARLTFNPWFVWQQIDILGVMNGNPPPVKG